MRKLKRVGEDAIWPPKKEGAKWGQISDPNLFRCLLPGKNCSPCIIYTNSCCILKSNCSLTLLTNQTTRTTLRANLMLSILWIFLCFDFLTSGLFPPLLPPDPPLTPPPTPHPHTHTHTALPLLPLSNPSPSPLAQIILNNQFLVDTPGHDIPENVDLDTDTALRFLP